MIQTIIKGKNTKITRAWGKISDNTYMELLELCILKWKCEGSNSLSIIPSDKRIYIIGILLQPSNILLYGIHMF